jgi:transposase
LSQWLFSALAEAGLPVICVETRHMRAVLKAQINKTDRNDARGIAQMMRVGLYRPKLRKVARRSFSTAMALDCSMFGLTCSRDQSGERDRPGAISRCGDEMMRTMLYEAAQSMLRSTRWSWLKAWAMKIARHRGVKRAIVALARRLAVIMHRIWVDGTEFRWTREAAAA